MTRARGLVAGGILDVLIGVPDLVEAIGWWQAFGYRVGQGGSLDAGAAAGLYGHASAARAVRLFHQSADHGLVRLVEWQRPSGPGLGLAPFKVVGSRWSAALVARLAPVCAHAKYARLAGRPIRVHAPDFVPAPGTSQVPFGRPISGAFEMALAQPLYRQVLFERVDADNPLYGQVNPGSLLRASQFTHCCVVTRGVPGAAFGFYDEALGLRRSGDFPLAWADIGSSGKDILALEPGEGFRLLKFDDPRSGAGPTKRSGRLTLFDFGADSTQADRRADALPGALGHTLYTLRLLDLEAGKRVVEAAGGTGITATLRNEFGERGFLATAPDGVRWGFVAAADSLPVRA